MTWARVKRVLGAAVSERVLEEEERPWRILVRLARDSVRRMELARFYLQPRRDPHGPTLALFVASLPPGLSERNYENILVEFLGAGQSRSLLNFYNPIHNLPSCCFVP